MWTRTSKGMVLGACRNSGGILARRLLEVGQHERGWRARLQRQWPLYLPPVRWSVAVACATKKEEEGMAVEKGSGGREAGPGAPGGRREGLVVWSLFLSSRALALEFSLRSELAARRRRALPETFLPPRPVCAVRLVPRNVTRCDDHVVWQCTRSSCARAVQWIHP